jgi:hypothetical protein
MMVKSSFATYSWLDLSNRQVAVGTTVGTVIDREEQTGALLRSFIAVVMLCIGAGCSRELEECWWGCGRTTLLPKFGYLGRPEKRGSQLSYSLQVAPLNEGMAFALETVF